MSGRPSTWPAYSVALALGTYAAFCAVASCVYGLSFTYGVLPWNGIRNFVVVPSVPGSSGSPRLISCKVVPSCRNEGRFAQGPPLAAPNPRRTPSERCQEKWLSATWNRGHHLPEKSQSQMGWAHETRRVRLYATRPWDDGIRGTEGTAILRSSNATHGWAFCG